MIVNEHKYYDEFWGAKYPTYEYDVEESYSNEVFDFLAMEIKRGLDVIPNEIGVLMDGSLTLYDGDIIIDPYDYLTEEQVEELEKLIEEE